MIIYFTPGGRIGNQLFQYARAVGIAKPKELIIFGQMEEFCSIFKIKRRLLNIHSGFWIKVLERTLLPICRLLFVQSGFVSSIIEKDGQERKRTGLLKSITWMEGYFQKAHCVTDNILSDIELNDRYLLEAESFLVRNKVPPNYIFVHVRRGDYLNYIVLGNKDPSLPAGFFNKALASLSVNKSTPLILVGDDPSFVADTLSREGWMVFVSTLAPAADFALMIKAAGGILSNSTFAWWAGKLNGKRIAAPRFWLGWRSNRWYPDGIQDESFIWLEV